MKLSVPNRLKGKKLYKEVWKPVVLLDTGESYEGLYEVSNMGRVRNSRTGRMLKIRKDNRKGYGYLNVGLFKDGKRKQFKVHRLVAFAFVDGYFEGAVVDHLDTNRTNNVWTNLRFVTRKENCNNSLTRKHNSEAKQGENNPMYGKCGELSPRYGKHHTEETKKKMSENHPKGMLGKHHSEETKKKMSKSHKGKPVYCLETNKTYPNAEQCAKELGLWATSIRAVCNGKQKHHKGFHFYYEEDILYKS